MIAEILEKKNNAICMNTATPSKQSILFGGRTVILFGDLLLAAVTNNTSALRRIYSSHLWANFVPSFLSEN